MTDEELREKTARKLFNQDLGIPDVDITWKNCSAAVHTNYLRKATKLISFFEQVNYVKLADDTKGEIDKILRLWLPGKSCGYNEATETIWRLLKGGTKDAIIL